MKGLEAKLKEITFCHGCKYEYASREECPCNLITKALKDKEKKDKALEIITRLFTFRLNVSLGDKSHQNNIRVCISDDNKCEYAKWDSLTDEEYDLLKEVLLWKQ